MIKYYLKLIRYQNLLIILFTMLCIRYCIIYPYYNKIELNFFLSDLNFFFLALAIVLIAAGGYVYNDFFDIKTDSINHPKDMIVGIHISRKKALLLSNLLSFIGLLFGTYVSYKINHLKLSLIFVAVVFTLWIYTWFLKKYVVISNFTIATLTALVPFYPFLYEILSMPEFYVKHLSTSLSLAINNIFYFSLSYSIFAFLTTFLREILKDISDFEGDIQTVKNTIPIVFGVKFAKFLSIFLIITIITLLLYILFNYLKDFTSFVYITLLIIVPFLYCIYKMYKANKNSDFYKISQIVKVIMLLGLGYSFVVFFKL